MYLPTCIYGTILLFCLSQTLSRSSKLTSRCILKDRYSKFQECYERKLFELSFENWKFLALTRLRQLGMLRFYKTKEGLGSARVTWWNMKVPSMHALNSTNEIAILQFYVHKHLSFSPLRQIFHNFFFHVYFSVHILNNIQGDDFYPCMDGFHFGR